MEPKRPGPVPRAPATDEETRPSEARQRAADAATRVSRNSVPSKPVDDRTEAAPPRRAVARPAAPPIPQQTPGPEQTTGAGGEPEPPQVPLVKGQRNRGAVPQQPRATPTRTQRVLAGLQREWRYAAGLVAACVGLGWLSWWLYSSGYEMLAAVAGLAIIPVLLAAFFIKRAPCPRCGRSVTIIGIEQCEHCREYIYIEGSELKVVGTGFIADWHSFELNVPIPIIPRLSFPVDRCCICGDRPDSEDTLDVQGTRLLVAHCVQHADGAQWQLGAVMEAVPTVTFKFRSFDYWRAVRQANWAHVRAGMWR